jgi:putative transposase
MPTLPRYSILEENCTFHVTWQCHNKSWLMRSDTAKKLYYGLLVKFKDRYRVKFYSYCFMSNHPHLTGTCESPKGLSDLFRIVNSVFARVINKRCKRRGQVVMDRFKSPVIHSDFDHLQVMFYIDLNPKRAKMVEHPKDYQWSSFHYYAYGKEDPLITPAPSYLNLGNTKRLRQKNYLKMIEQILQNDWKEKKPYSSVPFIGNPRWVEARIEQLRIFQSLQRKSWRARFLERFGLAS